MNHEDYISFKSAAVALVPADCKPGTRIYIADHQENRWVSFKFDGTSWNECIEKNDGDAESYFFAIDAFGTGIYKE